MKGSIRNPIVAIGGALLLLSLAGPVGSATISGKVTAPAGTSMTDVGAKVVATNAKYTVFSTTVNDDGTYSLDPVDDGTYTVVAAARGLKADPVKNVAASGSSKITQNFDLKEAAPFIVVKAANPIPLADGIDSDSFKDAPEIALNSGENIAVPASLSSPTQWGGPTTVSGRFKVKYSSLGLHVAADVTYKTPRVNNKTDASIWNDNCLEVDIQSDKYDPTRTAYDSDRNWQVGLSLGATTDWWVWGSVQARPDTASLPIGKYAKVEDKATKDGQMVRWDIPWAALSDSSGKGIAAPKDGDFGALDICIDAADPAGDPSTADRLFQLTWSTFNDTWTNPSSLVPVQFALGSGAK